MPFFGKRCEAPHFHSFTVAQKSSACVGDEEQFEWVVDFLRDERPQLAFEEWIQ